MTYNLFLLSPPQLAAYRREVATLAENLRLHRLGPDTLAEIRGLERHELPLLGSELRGNLHRWVRNAFGLWNDSSVTTAIWREQGPHLVNGVDCHPCHPDAVSAAIVEAVWEALRPAAGEVTA